MWDSLRYRPQTGSPREVCGVHRGVETTSKRQTSRCPQSVAERVYEFKYTLRDLPRRHALTVSRPAIMIFRISSLITLRSADLISLRQTACDTKVPTFRTVNEVVEQRFSFQNLPVVQNFLGNGRFQ